MIDKETLEAIGQMMDERINPIVNRLTGIEGRLDTIEESQESLRGEMSSLRESQEETRDGVNRLLEWADECGYVIKFPLPKV